MSWHSRTIDNIHSRLNFLRNRIRISTNHGAQAGPDIEIELIFENQERKINIEVQQFDSGAPWRRSTIPSWEFRHDFASLIIFPEPVLERVLNSRNNNRNEYEFFRRQDVYLFHDKQIEDVISLVIRLCVDY